jgi:DNA invertase Pin-like site-specific DNA recombinase
MKKPIVRKLRCAVYTRKSSEEGLEQEFNSLDAQREACEAYIASQKPEGWMLVPDRYDDGGISGATLERPALQRLLADIEARRVDVVVVYKIDRLSRALMDFAKLVEVFGRNSVTFVSVTQSFNTTTSMGRLTLNILLSFAQFEREVIGERIRDKFAASRKKGMWMGGFVPLGYDVKDRKLVVNKAEAATVCRIFERFVKLGSATELVRKLRAENIRGKQGKLVDKGYVYKLLNNRTYIGEAVHKGVSYPGEHQAIIDRVLWDRVHTVLRESPRKRAANARAQTPALLKGLIFGPTGRAMTPAHTRKGGKLYRYYVSTDVLKRDADACSVRRDGESRVI